MRILNLFIGTLILTCLISSCKTDEVVVAEESFDRTAFLTNYADNFIISSFDNLMDQNESFQAAVQQFESEMTVDHLNQLRSEWGSLYFRWLNLSSFNFGPAGAEGLRRTMFEEQGAFPPNTSLIESKINTGDFLLDDSFRATRGLCAIQYLIFKEQDADACLATFDNNRLNYLIAISAQFESFMANIQSIWLDSYRSTFISNLKTNVTSSTTQMYNGFLMDYFRISNYKVATSLGLTVKQTELDPHFLDVFYSGQSGTYLRYHFEVLMQLFEGEYAAEPNQIGWADYLIQSNEAGAQLVETIRVKQDVVRAAFDALPELPLEQLMQEEHPTVFELNDALADLYHLFESDMSSILGLAVTFDIDDGD